MNELKPVPKSLRIALLAASAAASLLSQTWQLTTLSSFVPIGDGAGAHPVSGVTIGKNGDLYGTTPNTDSGNAGYGVVYQLAPPASPGGAWTENPRYTFQDVEPAGLLGVGPMGGLAIGENGVLYGTTSQGGQGGSSGYGIVFALTPTPGDYDWPIQVMQAFAGGADGASPQSTLAIGKGGALYGATFYGGTGTCVNYELPSGCGTVFSLTPPESPGGAWTEAVLYSFTGGADGAQPSGVALNSDGVIFGTTLIGGMTGCLGPGCGTVFSLTPPASPGASWTRRTLYRFAGPPNDGGRPQSGVLISGGLLYGTCSLGGQDNGTLASFGTVFSLAPPAGDVSGPWSEAILYNFLGPAGGIDLPGIPMGLTLATNGVLYGVTQSGGPEGEGTVFSLTPPSVLGEPWTFQSLYDFTGGDDGGVPLGTLAIRDGVLYGTTSGGGSELAGTVFRLQP
ncbi:MAG: choice-of-anchor tandem repeat GloVer-containing protein [Bryobacteraceae bacterium]|jgi:uncharacterized repeat protein (TIGR03803 family)